MDKSEEVLKKRTEKFTEKIVNWFKDPYNLSLVFIILAAAIVRIYYFAITIDQTLWFDGLAYGSMARTQFLTGEWAGYPTGILFELMIRPPIIPFLWMIFMNLGFSEPVSKFILEFIPSVISVFLVYLIGKKIFDKRLALIAAFVLAFSWMHIFYSMRMLTHVPALFLALISMYFLFKSIEPEKLDQKYFFLAIFILSLAILIRYPFGLIGMSYFIFLVSIKGVKLFKDKGFWKGGLLGITPLIIFFLVNLMLFGHIFPSLGISSLTKEEQTENAYYTFGFFDHILEGPFFYLFLFGIAVILLQLVLGFGYIRRSKKLRFNLFLVILLSVNLIFLIYWLRVAEDRYLFEGYLTFIFAVAIGLGTLYSLIAKKYKLFGTILVVGLLLWGAYAQISYGGNLIENRSTSFSHMKEAFIWLDENAPENSKVLGRAAEYYTLYYTENLLPVVLPKTEPSTYDIFADEKGLLPDDWPNKGFDNYELTADYIVVSAYHPTQDYFQAYLDEISSQLNPVYAAFFDQEQQQPAVVIYQVNKNSE